MTIYLVDYPTTKGVKGWACSFWNSGGELHEFIKFMEQRFPDDVNTGILFWHKIESEYGDKPIKVCKPKPLTLEYYSAEYLAWRGAT